MGAHVIRDGEVRSRREAEVWQRLERVADPELDEPITEMGFIEAVRVSSTDLVEVEFRLPTYWCSPNFAFLMADGIRREVMDLPWVGEIGVTLHDHMYAEEMNAGVNAGRSFAEIFAELANGENLDDLKTKFRDKAFKKRQEAVLQRLKDAEVPDAAIVAMTLGELEAVALGGAEGAQERRRYREILGPCGIADGDGAPAFPTRSGASIEPTRLADHLAELRAVRINMEFNGALCRGLQKARYREVARSGGEPTLIDFMLNRV